MTEPTREQVMAWARACGDWNGQTCEMNDVGLYSFARKLVELARAEEKEACAQEAEAAASDASKYDIAEAIRARSKQ